MTGTTTRNIIEDGMRVLVTGADGFIGRSLCARLETLADGRDRTHPELRIEEIFRWTRHTTENDRRRYCREADFVFHLAGVNRPKHAEDYMPGNQKPLEELLHFLAEGGNTCAVMLASSAQASLSGRFAGSAYGQAKLACERTAARYAQDTGAEVLIYRFPNVFGKWCRPDYNSAVATFCHHIANDLPVQVNDPSTELTLVYIDDLVEEMLRALSGHPHAESALPSDAAHDTVHMPEDSARMTDGNAGDDGASGCPENDLESHVCRCSVPVTYKRTLGEIVSLLRSFRNGLEQMNIPEQPEGSFEKKLCAAWLSYLPEDKIATPLQMHADSRGSFTELLRSRACGQVSVNITKPGVTKGQHWHNTKWEYFIVVAGHGLIEERRIGSDEKLAFEVSGERIEAVRMLPGYTHSIRNLSGTEDLVTVMWANEQFDPERPDTYHEDV